MLTKSSLRFESYSILFALVILSLIFKLIYFVKKNEKYKIKYLLPGVNPFHGRHKGIAREACLSSSGPASEVIYPRQTG